MAFDPPETSRASRSTARYRSDPLTLWLIFRNKTRDLE